MSGHLWCLFILNYEKIAAQLFYVFLVICVFLSKRLSGDPDVIFVLFA
jgi:hypothetical protein